MDFSRTFIAIRKRSLLGLFDLSLLVYRDHAVNILLLLLINALPWILIDLLVLWVSDLGLSDYSNWHWKFLLLIVSQSQIGTMMITQYLGQAMFEGKPSIGEVVRLFMRASWYGIMLHGFVRMVFPILLLVLANDEFATGWAVFLLCFALLIRTIRPFVTEIMLLEKTPVRKKDDTAMTFGKRSSDLHRSEVVAGFILSSLFAVALTTMIAGLFFHIDSAIGLLGTLDLPIQFLYWPLAAWIVASFLAVFRFLFYINTRIIQEGWEVSLKVMAEGQKMERSLQP